MFEDVLGDPAVPVLSDEPPPWSPDTSSDWHSGFREHADIPPPGYSPANVQPSGWLALEVDAATGDGGVGLGDAELVDAVVALDHLTSWAQARQARLLAEFSHRRPGDDPQAMNCERPSSISRYAPDEIGLALHLARGTAMARLGQAAHLATTLPATLEAWEHGLLDLPKVRAITDITGFLPPEHAVAVQDRILDRAPTQTTGQLRAALARAVIAVDPEGAAERHRAARKDRRVVVGEETEGMASLWALLAAPDATSAYQWLTRLARGLGAEDPRSMDARRADLLVALLTGHLTITPHDPTQATESPTLDTGSAAETGPDPTTTPATSDPNTGDSATLVPTPPAAAAAHPAGPPLPLQPVAPGKPLVQILMPYTTLTGADDQPCELVGYGPLPADAAREIAADAVWTRLLTDPATGALLDYGRTTYRPPAALADHVRARDVYCRFPTCRRRALDADLDHCIPYPLGPTSDDNLYGGCHHHHSLKHHAGWTVTQHPDGAVTWTTPTGHTYTSHPHNYHPDPPPPPTPKPESAPAPTRPPHRQTSVADLPRGFRTA